MKNSDSKVVTGALIGGILGIGAIAVFLVVRKKDTSLDSIGKVISTLGEILENHEIDEVAPVKDFGKKLHVHEDTVCAVVDWLAAGISLWKKVKN